MVNPKLARVLWQGNLQDYVRAIAWSPVKNSNLNDRQTPILAAASAAGEVIIWQGQDPDQGLIKLRSADGKWISCLQFSADGQFLAAGGQDRQIKIWRVADLNINLNSNSDVASGTNSELEVIDSTDIKAESQSPRSTSVNTSAISIEPAYTIANNSDWIEHLAWNPTDAELLAFSQGSKVIIWQVKEQRAIAKLDFESSSVFDLAWHPGGEFIAVSGHGGVKVWDVQNHDQQNQDHPEPAYVLQVPGASLSCAWTNDGEFLASGNLDRTLSVLKWQSPPPWLMQGFPGKVQHLAWSPVSSQTRSPILAAACIDGITIWQQQAGQTAWQSQVLEKHSGFVQAIAFQPQTNHLASAATDGYVYFWQNVHVSQKSQQLYDGIKNGCACLAWDDAGQNLAIGGRSGELIVLSFLTQEHGKSKPKRGFG
jgi:WD40 repeat protein